MSPMDYYGRGVPINATKEDRACRERERERERERREFAADGPEEPICQRIVEQHRYN